MGNRQICNQASEDIKQPDKDRGISEEARPSIEGDGGGEVGVPVHSVEDVGHQVGQTAAVAPLLLQLCVVMLGLLARLVVEMDLGFLHHVERSARPGHRSFVTDSPRTTIVSLLQQIC